MAVIVPNGVPDGRSHMPFLVPVVDDRILLFCRCDPWHIYYVKGIESTRLETGFTQKLECSPSAWQDEFGLHISFIAGGADFTRYRLYRMDGPDITSLSAPVAILDTPAGFIQRDRTVFVEPSKENPAVIHIRTAIKDDIIEMPNVMVYSLSYCAEQPNKLIVSGQRYDNEELFALLYDIDTGEQLLVICDDLPAYKCTILGDTIIYTERIGAFFEDRRLRVAEKVEFIPTTIVSKRT